MSGLRDILIGFYSETYSTLKIVRNGNFRGKKSTMWIYEVNELKTEAYT